jgi:hypothetical protein
MKSVFEIEINVPQEKLAEMFADPEKYRKWMGDLEGYEIISGKPETVGSKYRLIALSPEKTKFISIEEFKFKGLSNSIGGFLYQRSIKGDHHRYTMNFKHFTENLKKS